VLWSRPSDTSIKPITRVGVMSDNRSSTAANSGEHKSRACRRATVSSSRYPCRKHSGKQSRFTPPGAAWAAQCKLEQAEIDNKNLTLDFDLATYSTYETQCTRIWATQAACDAFSDDPEWVTWHNRYLADTEQTLEIKTVII